MGVGSGDELNLFSPSMSMKIALAIGIPKSLLRVLAKNAQLRNRRKFSRAYSSNASRSGVVTPANQISKADLNEGKEIRGFGWFPTSFRIDPTEDCRIHNALVPNAAEVAATIPHTPPLLSTSFPSCHRDDTDVTERWMHLFKSFSLTPNRPIKRYTKELSVGIATSGCSLPGLVWNIGGVVLGGMVVTDVDESTLIGLRQGAITGSNIVIELLNQGAEVSRCIVPICTTNGDTMQFGAMFLLEPSFPVFICTSDVIGVGSFSGRRLASAYLEKAESWAKKQNVYLKKRRAERNGMPPTTSTSMVLDVKKYYVKVLTKEILERGLGLLCDDDSDIGPGLLHMSQSLELLFAVPELRKHVVFPLAFRSANIDGPGNTAADSIWMIFEDLYSAGYRMGTPDRIENPDLYDLFVTELCRIVDLVHKAGVIHCDLYPSNCMWRLLYEGEAPPPSSISVAATASTSAATSVSAPTEAASTASGASTTRAAAGEATTAGTTSIANTDTAIGGAATTGGASVGAVNTCVAPTSHSAAGSPATTTAGREHAPTAPAATDKGAASTRGVFAAASTAGDAGATAGGIDHAATISSRGGGRVVGIDIRIIDWDCSHCLYEGKFHPGAEEALSNHWHTEHPFFGKEHDLRYINVLKSKIEHREHEKYWKALASGDKSAADEAFYQLFSAVESFDLRHPPEIPVTPP